jgi:hypothetical protein
MQKIITQVVQRSTGKVIGKSLKRDEAINNARLWAIENNLTERFEVIIETKSEEILIPLKFDNLHDVRKCLVAKFNAKFPSVSEALKSKRLQLTPNKYHSLNKFSVCASSPRFETAQSFASLIDMNITKDGDVFYIE